MSCKKYNVHSIQVAVKLLNAHSEVNGLNSVELIRSNKRESTEPQLKKGFFQNIVFKACHWISDREENLKTKR